MRRKVRIEKTEFSSAKSDSTIVDSGYLKMMNIDIGLRKVILIKNAKLGFN